MDFHVKIKLLFARAPSGNHFVDTAEKKSRAKIKPDIKCSNNASDRPKVMEMEHKHSMKSITRNIPIN